MSPNTFDQSGQTVNGDQFNTANFYTGDQDYDVRGLANPYLGLKAFTYAEHTRYAGRDSEISRALSLLTTPGNEQPLLFITGASGSGKSSFAQAGLLPMLGQHYELSNPVSWASFRPGPKPLAALAGALRKLRLPATGCFTPAALYLDNLPINPAPTNQISLLLIDQFEELFSQAVATEREAIFTLLASLPSFRDLHMHSVITLRADYLPDLFAYPALYDQAKAGIDLRAMDTTQLALAIQHPLQVLHPHAGKHFQTTLLNRLTADASEDAAYLPLLQVTLEELWRSGFLTIDYYTSLTGAISQRADAIFAFTSDAAGNPIPRSSQQQATLLQILLDLVDVSPDGHQRRNVRRTQRFADLTRGQAATESLIRELATARLLSTGEKLLDTNGQPTQTVDIIHESLIHNWPRLQLAIQADREHLQQRRRFELRLDEWRSHEQSNDFLLTGVYLIEAEQLQQSDDVALQSPAAKTYLALSIGQRNRLQQAEIERQRVELERQHILATEQARRFEAEAKRATAEANRALTFRRATVIATTLLVIAIMLGIIAYNRQQVAEARTQEARARALIAQAGALQQQTNLLSISMLLAIEAEQAKPSPDAEELMRQGLTLLPKVNFAAPASAKITQVAFSADSAWVATADESGLVQIRTTLTGTLMQALQQHTVVRDLAFSPANSHWLATADNAGQACLWDVITGKQVYPCVTHTARVNKVRFSPNGYWLATASLDGKACLWVAATRQKLPCLTLGHEVQALAFSPHHPWLAASDDSGKVQLWDIAAAKQLASQDQHTPVLAIAFSQDDKLATAGHNAIVHLWAIDTAKAALHELFSFRHNSPVNDVAFSPDAQTLATVSDDKTVRLWDIARGWEKLRMYHTGFANVVIFSPNGKWVATASVDHTARLWDSATGQEIARLVHDNEVRTVVFSPDGQHVATGSTDKTTKVWALTDFEQSRVQLPGYGWALAYHPKLQQFVTTSDSGFSVTLWNALTGKPIESLPANRFMATALAFSHDGQRLATGSNDNSMLVWQLTSKTVIDSSHADDQVRAVAFSPDGACLANGGLNKLVQIHPLADRCKIARIPYTDTVTAITYSPSGQWLATASRAGLAQVMRVSTGALTTFSHGGPPLLAVAISPNEQWLATASVDRTARLWRLATGQAMAILQHRDEVRAIVFSPDNQWLVTGSADGTTRIWSVSNGQEVSRLQQATAVEAVTFSSDGQYLVTSSDKLVQVWKFPQLPVFQTSELISKLCTRLTRNLTQAEWTLYLETKPYQRTCLNLSASSDVRR